MYDKKVLGLAEAEVAVRAMIEEASKNQPDRPASFAVVDEGGELIMLARMDGARVFFSELAIRKAKAAAALSVDTRKFLEKKKSADWGQHEMFPGYSFIPGGLAVTEPGGAVAYGGIGVSGKSPADVDEVVAFAGLEALQGYLWPSK